MDLTFLTAFKNDLQNIDAQQYLDQMKSLFEFYSAFMVQKTIQYANEIDTLYKQYLQEDVTYIIGLLEIYWIYIGLVMIILYLTYTYYDIEERYAMLEREKEEFQRKYIETCERLESIADSNRVNIRKENRELKYHISLLEKENEKIPELKSQITDMKHKNLDMKAHIDFLEIQKEKHEALLQYPSFEKVKQELKTALHHNNLLKKELKTLTSKYQKCQKSLETYRGFRTNTDGYFIIKGDSSDRQFRTEMRTVGGRYLGKNEYLIGLEYLKDYEDKIKN